MALLMAMLLGLRSGEALAQEVNVPKSRNPYLGRIARLYEALEYEAALKLLPKAQRHPSNRSQELLWLELMRGILYFSLQDTEKSEAVFRAALEKAPFASLPLLTPSQGLYEHFNALRQRAAQGSPPPPASAELLPGRDDSGGSTRGVSLPVPVPESPSSEPTHGLESERLVRPISREVLEKRVRDMKEWLLGNVRDPMELLRLLEQLEQSRKLLERSKTAHERMFIAIDLDSIEKRLARRFGRKIQASALPAPVPAGR